MAELARIYLVLVGSRVRSQLAYRASFSLMLVGQIFLTFTDFLAIAVIFTHLRALDGWTLPEVSMLYGSSALGLKLGDLFLGQVERVSRLIRTGSFDLFMIRPLPSLMQVVTSDLGLHQLGALVQGTAVLVFGATHAGIDWGPARVSMLAVTILSGCAIFGALFVTANAISFWLVDSGEVANAFTYGGAMVGQYPLGIFGAWLRRLAIFVVPIAFATYLPTLYLLDKPDALGLPAFLRFGAPVAAVGAWAIASLTWRVAVRRYRSTGS